jgi:hypothetical protein
MALTKQDFEELFKKRNTFISIGGQITKIISPKLFQLFIENRNNLRNIVIIAGALASFSLYVMGNTGGNINIIYLKISIIGLLMTIIFSSFYLNKSISKDINAYTEKLRENLKTSNKAQNIINDCFDGKISKSEADRKMLDVYKEIEYKRIRPKEENIKKVYIFDLITGLFILSIGVEIFYFIYGIF